MISLLPILTLGFFIGMRHAVDPDHVVAVTTIVSRQRSIVGAGRVGALWGIGHTVTIALAGGAIILFKLAIPPRLGLAMELLVALMLILLGAYNLSGRAVATDSRARPFAIGFVHGLAGSAAVALLVVTAIPQPGRAVAYLLIFGLGTIAGMMLITAAIATPALYSTSRFGSAQRYLRVASGAASVAFGVFLVFQIGWVDGLFTSAPLWSPR